MGIFCLSFLPFFVDSKVVEHDELERGSDINRLELAYRRENDFDTTLMTVSMSKNDNIDVNTRSSLVSVENFVVDQS